LYEDYGVNSGEMYKYYSEKDFLPTFANFEENQQLQQYENSRKHLFQKLKMPLRVFQNANLIEFGPDTGENAVVFAKWGSNIFIVEPNVRSLRRLQENFVRFGFSERILGISDSPLQSFSSPMKFDFIVAEGFICTIRPNQLWIDNCYSLLNVDGFLLMSYMETTGSLFELLYKIIYRYGCEVMDDDSIDVANTLFKEKWDSIPHTRSFHSWYMDVIKNPYVRYNYLNTAHSLVKECENAGLNLYSSWPIYEDGLHVAWHKSIEHPLQRSNRLQQHIKKSILTYVFGEKCFYTGKESHLNEIVKVTEEVICLMDQQIDGVNVKSLMHCSKLIDSLASLLQQGDFHCENNGLERCNQKLDMLGSVLHLILANKYRDLEDFCARDSIFINTWGMPHHIAIFQKG